MMEEEENNDMSENLYLDEGRTLNLAFRVTDAIPEYLINNSSAHIVQLVDLTETCIKYESIVILCHVIRFFSFHSLFPIVFSSSTCFYLQRLTNTENFPSVANIDT